MTVQHADLFHCLACGRVAYEPHGGPAPDCCGQPMVRAVAGVIPEAEPKDRDLDPQGSHSEHEPTGDLEEHALFAEVVEISQWCHGLWDVDIARSEELADRMSALHRALVDHLELQESDGPALHPRLDGPEERLVSQWRELGRQLVASIARFVAELRADRSPFTSWAQISDRLDVLVAQFRQYVHVEGELFPGGIGKTGKLAR